MTTGQMCTVCVMDQSNPAIQFDESGQCNCCRDAIRRMPYEWWPGEEGNLRMQKLVALLKHAGTGKKYDVMVGLSGGIDSAYLVHLAVKKYGLRVLAVHVDGGWNSEPAVRNIESIVRGLNIDLFTHVVEWQEMRDIQLSFLKASVLNQDIPQDHAFFSTLYRTAEKFGIKHFLSGVNFASECVVPPGFGHPSMDGIHARAIQKQFGTTQLKNYKFMSMLEFLWLTRIRKVLNIYRPLNYMNYDKEQARIELTKEYGWCDYGGKHSESRFTKFYQEIYLLRKFNFDKRALHLSSLIVSGQITRSQAVNEISSPISTESEIRRDLRFVAKKLGIDTDKLIELIAIPAVDHLAYPNGMRVHAILNGAKRLFRTFSTVR